MIPPPPVASTRTAPPAGPPDPRPGCGLPLGDRSGFTLLELVIVTVLLGILAMITFPIYQNLRGTASQAALREQLRTLARAQQMHALEFDAYTADVSDLDYRPAEDLELELRIGSGGGGGGGAGAGWTGRLTDPGFRVRCAVFYGDTDPFEPAVLEGEIACDE